MTSKNQRVYLDELSRRWQKSPDEILKMAAKDTLKLWFEFQNVIVQKVKKKKTPAPQLVASIEIQLQPELIAMMIGRTDRVQVAAEYSCLTPKGKQILISNAAGEEWGETSMVGLNPMRIFAVAEELPKIEKKQGIIPFGVETATTCCCQSQSHSEEDAGEDDDAFISADHPCFAPELHIALECWLELMGEEEEPDAVQKADILQWLREHHPNLTKTATERIAKVVTPAGKQRR